MNTVTETKDIQLHNDSERRPQSRRIPFYSFKHFQFDASIADQLPESALQAYKDHCDGNVVDFNKALDEDFSEGKS